MDIIGIVVVVYFGFILLAAALNFFLARKYAGGLKGFAVHHAVVLSLALLAILSTSMETPGDSDYNFVFVYLGLLLSIPVYEGLLVLNLLIPENKEFPRYSYWLVPFVTLVIVSFVGWQVFPRLIFSKIGG